MLKPNTVYFKTQAGIQEVKARVLGLRAELRRLLILVDGNAPLSRLAIFVRGSEIDSVIAELEVLGLVTSGTSSPAAVGLPIAAPASIAEPVQRPATPPPPAAAAAAAPAPAPTLYANLAPTAAQLLAVRNTAIRTLHEMLGPDADSLAIKIERCIDAQELRVVITDIRQTLDRQMGTDKGQRFLEEVRAAAEDTR